ncbi:TRAP transporter large permease [Cloacibacillus sp.]|uniref:TRAP transporter large permease n=1 Tax=Cloacibacillus sp. TaxID=2049023 RepID=UPI0025BBC2D5|nr:TRAP transporter large permease [Cloacibacillus sp.]MCC8056564.1 TRAP transporter large permease [Cloacibacillus sp.]
MEFTVLFGSFLVLILLTVPVGYVIGISTLITLYFFSDISFVMISQNAVAGVDSFSLLAIPFFILAGSLMSAGGLVKRLLNFANICVGAVTGGLAMVTTVTCMFFAALSGSAVATTSAVGSFMIPAMKEKGYDEGFAAALAAAAGTIGIIIPPSIPLVIYGVVVGASIGELFIAGIIPGIIMGLAILIVCYVISKKKGYRGTAEKLTLKSFSHSFVDAIWAFMAPGIILGGIYWGICTPTEAAVIAVLYSLFTGVVIYRELTFAKIYDAFVETLTVNGATTFMVGLSMAFASYLIMAGLPQQIAAFLISITDSRIVLFMIVNLFLLAVGSLIDPIPAIIILAPILLPVMTKFGMSPVTFGVVLVANLAIGYITPPYGVNLFVAMAVAKIPMERMFKYIVALFFAMLVALILITYCDSATMHLVRFLK